MQRIVKLSIILFSIFFTLYIFSTSNFVRMWADDFCTAATLNQYGFWDSLVFSWNSWSGRYSYNFVIYFFMLFGPQITKIVPIIILIALFASTEKIVGKLIPLKSKILSLSLSVAFVVIILANTPNIIQSFYWYGGTLIYALPFVFLNLILYLAIVASEKLSIQNKLLCSRATEYSDIRKSLFTPLIHPRNKVAGYSQSLNKKYFLTASFLTSVVSGGFSETFVVIQIIFLSFIFILNLLVESKDKDFRAKIIISGIFGSLISLMLMYFAPGTLSRSSTVSKPESILWVIRTTYDSAKEFVRNTISSKVFTYSAFFVFSSIYFLFQKNILNIKNKIGMKKITLVFTLTFLLVVFTVFSIFAISYYSMAYHPPERAMIIPVYIIFICIGIISFTLIYILTHNPKVKKSRYLNTIIFLSFLVSITLLTRDTYRRWKFIKNDLRTYADEWNIDENLILNQRDGNKDIYIKYIPPVGRIDGFKDNKGWVLSCLAGYYNVKSVKILE